MKKVEKDKNKGNKDKYSKTPTVKDKRSVFRASSTYTFHTYQIQTYSQIKNVNREIFFFSVVFLCLPLSKPYISIQDLQTLDGIYTSPLAPSSPSILIIQQICPAVTLAPVFLANLAKWAISQNSFVRRRQPEGHVNA